jgi:hypothetical protein
MASTPASGHLYPLLTAGRTLLSHGHEVVMLSAHAMRELIEDTGATVRGFPPMADFDLRNVEDELPGYFGDIPAGPELNLWALKRASVDTIPAQHEAIQRVLLDINVAAAGPAGFPSSCLARWGCL